MLWVYALLTIVILAENSVDQSVSHQRCRRQSQCLFCENQVSFWVLPLHQWSWTLIKVSVSFSLLVSRSPPTNCSNLSDINTKFYFEIIKCQQMFQSYVSKWRKNFKLVTNEALGYGVHATSDLETSSICKLRVKHLHLAKTLEGFLPNKPALSLRANPGHPVLESHSLQMQGKGQMGENFYLIFCAIYKQPFTKSTQTPH